jgi:hypothetical protein
MKRLSKKAVAARIKERKSLRYRTWAPTKSYLRTMPSPFVVVRAHDVRDYDVVHRLDCRLLQSDSDTNKRALYVSRFQDIRLVGRQSHQAICQCRPKPNDAYYQCLVCGTFIPSIPPVFNATCACKRLTVDPMAPITDTSPVTVICTPGEYRLIRPGPTIRKLKK